MTKDKQKIMQQYAELTTLGLQLAIPIFAGVLIGNWLDGKYDSGVKWTLILSLSGVVVGFYTFLKTIIKSNNNKKNKT